VEALNNIDVGAADRIERPHLMLSVFEGPLFMCREFLAECGGDSFAKIGRCIQRK
jgi:hypothetical protein